MTTPEPFLCRCWLGDGKTMCDTPAQCGPAIAEPMFEEPTDDAQQ